MNVTVTVYCTFFIDADAITFSLTEHNGDSKVSSKIRIVHRWSVKNAVGRLVQYQDLLYLFAKPCARQFSIET